MPAFHFDSRTYNPAVGELLTLRRLPELGPGRPNQATGELLGTLTPETLVSPHHVGDREAARTCLAGLWLYHNFLDESHRISQEIDTVEGSYWHGIMHRREPDFSNAKYWFRRVGDHPISTALATAVGELVAGDEDEGEFDFLARQPSWDHFRFVDLCEAAAGRDGLQRLCRKIQFCEWQLLFDHCFRRACADSAVG